MRPDSALLAPLPRLFPAALVALLALVAAGCAGGAGPDAGPEPTAGERAAPEGGEAPATPDTAGGRRAADVGPPDAPSVVARVRMTVEPAEFRVGDTARVEVAAVDTTGVPIPAVSFRIRAPRRTLSVIQGGGAVIGLREGAASVTAVPVLDGVPLGGAEPGSAAVHVRPAPLTRLEIRAPARLYAETRGRAAVRALTAFGPRERTPSVRWRSSDPAVLRATPHGGLIADEPGRARLEATAESVSATVDVRVVPNPIRRLRLTPESAEVKVGEVVHLSAVALDADGRPVEDAVVEWTIGDAAAGPDDARPAAIDAASGSAGGGARVDPDGAFVANAPGVYRVIAAVGGRTAAAEISARPRPERRRVTVVGHHPAPAGSGSTTDLWVFEGVDGRDYAYTGTLAAATMYAWDVTDPSAPVLADSVKLDGRRVNDVKINGDATLAVVTSEGAPDRRNGITVLDILDPAHPRPVSHFTERLTGGVHNVWIEGDLVYAVHNGTRDLHIVDVSDPTAPRHVGRWGLDAEGRALHDVTVKDGFAYLSYWNDGLVILDVGAGIAGGTPTEPRFVSRHVYSYELQGETYGNTHHAVRYRNWVFVADEILGCAACETGPRGYVHVIDVADIEDPVEVAFYRVPEAGAHNLWVEDDRLYVAYYQAGLRIVDVAGELRGDLWRQGREIGRHLTESPAAEVPNATMSWGPQPHKGEIYVSDLNSGLWILRLESDEDAAAP